MKPESTPPYPKLGKLDVAYCRDVKERWIERRAILVAQRDIRLAHVRMIESLDRQGVKNLTSALDAYDSAIAVLNKRIDECNEMIESIEAGAVAKGRELRRILRR